MPIYPQSGEGTVNGLSDDECPVPAGRVVQPPIGVFVARFQVIGTVLGSVLGVAGG